MAHHLGVIYIALTVLAGGIAGFIFLLSVGVTYRRRRLSYFLISVALAGLAARSGVAAIEIAGLISFSLHHTLEHALDGLIAIALLAAIISMGAPREGPEGRSVK